MHALPENVKQLLSKKVFAHLATVMPDGAPQVSPVWVDVDGDTILVNSAEGRLKDKNVRKDKRVALSVTDPDNPYHSVSIRGRVVDLAGAGVRNRAFDQFERTAWARDLNGAHGSHVGGAPVFDNRCRTLAAARPTRHSMGADKHGSGGALVKSFDFSLDTGPPAALFTTKGCHNR